MVSVYITWTALKIAYKFVKHVSESRCSWAEIALILQFSEQLLIEVQQHGQGREHSFDICHADDVTRCQQRIHEPINHHLQIGDVTALRLQNFINYVVIFLAAARVCHVIAQRTQSDTCHCEVIAVN